ncbi:MAG: isochorismatase family protein [Pseudomonadota bacterium]
MARPGIKDREQDYAAAGFGQRLGFGARPALLVVDFVVAYLKKDSPLYAGVRGALGVNKRLVAAARKAGVPVVWTRVEYLPGGTDGGHFYRKVKALKVFERGSPLGAFPPGLKPRQGELVLTKQYPSAFFGTPLAAILTAWRVDSVVVSGLTTSGCVRASALDALQHGFIPIVVKDGCGDRDPQVAQANLFDLAAKYADVVPAGAVLAYFAALG